ncbi:DUF5127 and DUF4965 domain-containing protein [Phanerochaete sordida]|uniref:DUF5127 and DUF4965 domain-containing protein n=1 Tax=Phanerochaete sordida TaxID=48140 RepID=A0A9P3GKI5_9APHY|nr:DUF5127 and DUF4965 domain-containing protein [Phanerochaete sordida]
MCVNAGPIDVNVTYLSPIEPTDPVKQSFPISYVSLTAASNDGQPHAVQVYLDITGEWLSGDRSSPMYWNTTTGPVILHEALLVEPQPLAEKGRQAQDATLYFGALSTEHNTTWQADLAPATRAQFKIEGHLTNQSNRGPMAINANSFEVFAVSMDLGLVTETTNPVVWAVALTRDPAIVFMNSSDATEMRSPYWATSGSASSLVTSYLQNFQSTMDRAVGLDESFAKNAATISPQLVDLVSLAARQVMASTELTVGGSAGQYDVSDVKMFMKDIDSSLNGRVNPVEILYGAFPFFLTINATLGGWLLRPILDFASSSSWHEAFAPADIGSVLLCGAVHGF